LDDILINGTYNGLIPQSPSFSFYAKAYRDSTNITDVYIHLYSTLLEPIPNVVDEIKLKLLDKNNNTIATKTYSNAAVEFGDVIHFHGYMNCTYVNASVNIKRCFRKATNK
ncbi:MAG: hypothetical protein QMD21_07910, partial [Candidatus Thermoplasmatota archaeon]|nr:hypothetical protein [Candidatus Thermoplasmatota archaeon]